MTSIIVTAEQPSPVSSGATFSSCPTTIITDNDETQHQSYESNDSWHAPVKVDSIR